MPVIVNAETGLAEDLPDPLATQALQQGSHHVALNDPEGNPVTAPYHNAHELMQAGYTQPSPDQLQNLLRFAKFSSPTEQIKTALEGAGEATSFGTSTAGEVAAGVNPQDIIDRKAVNPGVHQIGQVAGLVASDLTGIGEAAMLGKLGKGAASAMGLGAQGAGFASRVGAQAVKDAITFAGIQSGDEVSKMILGQQDPAAPVETALAHIGLSGLIGAGAGGMFGALSPLWESAAKTKLGQYLQAMRDKGNAAEGLATDLPLTDNPSMKPELKVDELARKVGMELTPVMRAALSANPEWAERFRVLIESSTGAGREAQGALRNFIQGIHDKVLESLGTTEADVTAAKGASDHDMGLEMINAVTQDVAMDHHPMAQAFEKIREAYKDVPIAPPEKAALASQLATIAREKGYDLKGTPANKILQNLYTWIEEAPNLQRMRTIYTTLNGLTSDTAEAQLMNFGMDATQALEDFEHGIVERELAVDQPEMIGKNRELREEYSALMQDIRRVNQRLRVGPYAGPDTFLGKLAEMKPEQVLQRLTPLRDANLLALARERFPSLIPAMREAYMNTLLRSAAKEAKDPFVVQPFRLFDVISKWSPEVKSFALPQGAEEKILAAQELSKLNPFRSNSLTAKNLDSMWSKLPGGAMAMLSMAEGKNPIFGYIMGEGGRLVAREAPDAMTLATLKMLGDSKPVEPGAFKNAVDFIYSTYKGENTLGKAVKSIFKSGAAVLPQNLYPTPAKKDALKKRLAELELDNKSLLNVGGNSGYYLPDQAMAMGAAAARVTNILNGMRPRQGKMAMLSGQRVPSQAENSAFENALTIAEQPLVTLPRIQNGTLTMHDVKLFQQLYPALHARVSQKLMDEVIDQTSKGKLIPYHQRLALSRFIGQPLDASMNPQAVIASQPKQQQAPPYAQPKKSGASLNKFAARYQTPMQSRSADRSGLKS